MALGGKLLMNNRDLFHATMHRENGGDLLHIELAFNVPYKKWYSQGMPLYVKPGEWWPNLTPWINFYDHFNASGFIAAPRSGEINQFCEPPFIKQIINEDGDNIIYINALGNIMRELKDSKKFRRDDGSYIGSPPTELDFRIKSQKDYEENRHLFTNETNKRLDYTWLKENADKVRNQQDYLTTIWIHGPFAYLREIVGTEMAIVMPFIEPEWTNMMLRDHLNRSMTVFEEPIKMVKHDFAFVWEDCCGRSGPFMSPNNFDEMFAWWYKEWKDYTCSMGIPWVMLDTDGDPAPLIPKWYENGVDSIHPFEVNSTDMLKIAETYPDYVLMGGINKHMFEPDAPEQVGKFNTDNVYTAIDAELERVVKPMRKRGGYFPSLDHGAHWAVDYQPYLYYSDKLYDYGKANTTHKIL